MQIIKLNATDSTNRYLKELAHQNNVSDFTVVTAKKQTNGRGQMGTSWQSQSAKNLTFSVFKEVAFVKIKLQFYISIATSLALVKTLQQFSVPKIRIKWPNDILSENKKVCGILIESVIKSDELKASIIGVGLNVNQTEFNNLPQASSLKLVTGMHYDLDEVLQQFLKQFEYYINELKQGNYKALKNEYENVLFRKEKPSTFKTAEGKLFSGFIESVTQSGNLKIRLEDNVTKEFAFKTIRLLY